MRVALASAAGANDGDAALLIDALGVIGVAAEEAVWDDPGVAWERFDLVVVRSTWDYTERRGQFLTWAASRERLANPYEAIAFSSDKRYLFDLAARGVPVVAGELVEVGYRARFPEGDFVVKPCVGAGSMHAERFSPDEHERARELVGALHARGRAVLVQPYVTSVDERGERALIFIGGRFSHAMTKGAMLNVPSDVRDQLYRREQMSRADAEPEALALAASVLSDFTDLTYARVDLLATEDGWAVLELEMVEPSLFLAYDEGAPARLAAAIRARLD